MGKLVEFRRSCRSEVGFPSLPSTGEAYPFDAKPATRSSTSVLSNQNTPSVACPSCGCRVDATVRNAISHKKDCPCKCHEPIADKIVCGRGFFETLKQILPTHPGGESLSSMPVLVDERLPAHIAILADASGMPIKILTIQEANAEALKA